MSDFDKKVEGGLVGYLIAKAMEPEPAPAPAPIIINHYIEVPAPAPVVDEIAERERLDAIETARLDARTMEEVRAEEWVPFNPDDWDHVSRDKDGVFLFPRFGRQYPGEQRKEYLYYLPELEWYTISSVNPVKRAGPGWVFVRDDPEYGHVISVALQPEELRRLCTQPVPPAKARRWFSPWGYEKPVFIAEELLAADAYWSKLKQRMRYRVNHPLVIAEAVEAPSKLIWTHLALVPQAWTYPKPGEAKDVVLAGKLAEEMNYFNSLSLAAQQQAQNDLMYWSPLPASPLVVESEYYQEDPNDQEMVPDVANLLLSESWFADSGFISPPTTLLPKKPVPEVVAVVVVPDPNAEPYWDPEAHFGRPRYQKPNLWRRFQNMMAGREDVEY